MKLLRFRVAKNFPQLYGLYLAGFWSFISSSNGFTIVQCDGLKKKGIENLSLSKFTITLCSTLSYLSLLQT